MVSISLANSSTALLKRVGLENLISVVAHYVKPSREPNVVW